MQMNRTECGLRSGVRKVWPTAMLALACFGLCQAHAAAPETSPHPVLRVPKFAKAPTIDGKLDVGEWANAAAVTGFGTGGPSSTDSLVPEVQQVVWRIGYDDKFLYLAMRSPQAKGTTPNARTKEPDSEGVLFEDHVEIQVCPHDRSKATTPGFGFYKAMVKSLAGRLAVDRTESVRERSAAPGTGGAVW